MDFKGWSVFAGGCTVRAGDLLSGEVDLDVVLHVVLPSHDLATHGTPPLVAHLGHVGIRVYSCKT